MSHRFEWRSLTRVIYLPAQVTFVYRKYAPNESNDKKENDADCNEAKASTLKIKHKKPRGI